MTTLAETRLHERAATLAVRQLGPRTWQVASASQPGMWHILKGAAGESFEDLHCGCQGGRGRCAHRVRLAARLNIEVPDAAMRRRPATNKPTDLLLAGDPAAVMGAAAGSAGEGHDTTGAHSMDDVGVFGTKVIVIGAIADRATAVQASGKLEGGANLSLDLPDDEHLAEIIGALTAMRRLELRITIEPVKKSTGE